MGPPLPSSSPLLQRMLMNMCIWASIKKTVVGFLRNLLIHPVVLPQDNYQKITVPPIRWLNIWQEIASRFYFNRWSVDSVNKKRGERNREDTCGGSCILLVQISIAKIIFGQKKNRIGSLASHLGVLDDEFEELLAAGKLSKVRSWYKKLGMRVQTHRDNSITWIQVVS